MGVNLTEHIAPQRKRQKLGEKHPISTPYVAQFIPIYVCNFTCKYWCHTITVEEWKFVSKRLIMNYMRSVYKN